MGKTNSMKPLRSIDDLQNTSLIDADTARAIAPLSDRYTIAVTPDMAALIANKNDPIGKQFIPDPREAFIATGEHTDPIGDYAHAPLRALVHRHQNRVLLKPTMACAVYCRFCFRREMVGPNGDTITQSDIDDALNYIAQNTDISEVILTGGDPFMLSAKKLGDLMARLNAMPHVRMIRFHTRVPVVAPLKITDAILDALEGRAPVYVALHANHAREFTPAAADILARMARRGVVLLGQSVLLAGVNDTVDALLDLFQVMLDNRVKPYYLHHPDMTAGTSHFRLTLERGMALMNALRARAPSGLAIPQYTLDIPGGVSKIPITPEYIKKKSDGTWSVRDPAGGVHAYCDSVTE